MTRIAAILASILVLAACSAPGAAATASPSSIPEHICSKPVRAAGQSFGVEGSGVRCNFMTFWTDRFIAHGGTPKGWTCVDLGETGNCHKRHTPGTFFDYYALD